MPFFNIWSKYALSFINLFISLPTGEISLGAGVGTDGTSFMMSVKENNWLGRGIKLETAVNVSEERISGNFALANPNYNYSGNSIFTSLDVSSTDKATTSGYKSTRTGFELGTSFEQYENIYLSPSFNLSFEDIEVESDATATMKKMEGTYSNLDFIYGITLDRRDQPFQPTSGYITKFDQEIPIVIDTSSISNGLSISNYHSFSEDVVGALKFYARSIHGLQGEDTRLTNRLFIPQRRLRGFNTRRVGPKDGNDYVGGNYISTLGFEAQLPNLLPESTRTDVSVFVDTANVWGVDYNSSLDDTNTIRSSFGVSANMFTTIGPLSFTVAQNITKATNDETETFNFRLGTSF